MDITLRQITIPAPQPVGEARWYELCDAEGRTMGKVELIVARDPEIRIGGHLSYTVFPAYRGKGVATEGCKLVLEQAKQECGMDHVDIAVWPDNHISQRVAEKLGGKLVAKVTLTPEHRLYDSKHPMLYHYRVYL